VIDPEGCRRFGIADAVLLAVATLSGLAAGRERWSFLIHLRPRSWADGQYQGSLGFLYAVVPLLAAWTIALLAIWLRRPRRRLRRAILAPGGAAIAASSLSIAVTLAIYVLLATGRTTPWSFGKLLEALFMNWQRGGCHVIGAWAVLAFCGRWKPEPCWLDRLGRVLGFSWIGFAAAYGLGTLSGQLFRP
jgi:hypothetical protein